MIIIIFRQQKIQQLVTVKQLLEEKIYITEWSGTRTTGTNNNNNNNNNTDNNNNRNRNSVYYFRVYAELL